MNEDVHVGDNGQCPQGQIGSQEASQMLVGSNPSCVERRQGQQTGRFCPRLIAWLHYCWTKKDVVLTNTIMELY
jgi:hypothetical protein